MEIEQISKAPVGPAYTAMRTFDTLEKAAGTQGGTAGDLLAAGLGLGIGLGAGVPTGKQLGKALSAEHQPPQAGAGQDVEARLLKLKKLLDQGLITQEDFNVRKKQILDEI
jgi:membrane protease subunit (stomatin/prohibitin family)